MQTNASSRDTIATAIRLSHPLLVSLRQTMFDHAMKRNLTQMSGIQNSAQFNLVQQDSQQPKLT